MTADLTHTDEVGAAPRRGNRIRQRPPFGLTTRVWTYVKVFVGAAISCLAVYAVAQHAVEWQPAAWDVADRLALVAKVAALALFPALAVIAVVAAQRLNPEHFSGGEVRRDSPLDINVRFLHNTFEQFLVYFVGNAALALYVLPVDAEALPVLGAMFFSGRVLYWLGYHHNSYLRSFGFGFTFYPTVAVFAWLALYVTTGLYIDI